MDLVEPNTDRRMLAIQRFLELRMIVRNDNFPAKIEEGLFLGSYEAANNKNELKKLNITHVLTVANIPPPKCSNEFVCKGLNVLDRKEENIVKHFDDCFGFIDEAKRTGGGALVHCFVGKSRSVTIVLAYLMKNHGMSLSQALEHVKGKRPIASPNRGFISQLEEYEKSLRAHEEEEEEELGNGEVSN